jgi:hypothetical protein
VHFLWCGILKYTPIFFGQRLELLAALVRIAARLFVLAPAAESLNSRHFSNLDSTFGFWSWILSAVFSAGPRPNGVYGPSCDGSSRWLARSHEGVYNDCPRFPRILHNGLLAVGANKAGQERSLGAGNSEDDDT